LAEVNAQARQWLAEVANQRQHRETGQAPNQRFRIECLKPLPALTPDYRDSAEGLVHKDLRLSFDGNRYCVPPRYVGRKLTVKADSSSVTLYDQHHEVVRYARSWERGRTFGAERFQKELLAQMAAAERSAAQQRLVALLGPTAEDYLRRLADTDASSRQVRELLVLFASTAPIRWPRRWRRRTPPAPSAPTTSPTSCASSKCVATFSRLCASKTPS
jgi:hypothetical protein